MDNTFESVKTLTATSLCPSNQNNNIQSLHEDTFCDQHDRSFIRHNLEDIRLDGNPLNINLFAQAYICLPRLPVGSH